MVELRLSQFVALLVIFFSIIASSNGECTRTKTAMARLKENLFCNYDRFSRPVKNFSTPVGVSFVIEFKRVEMEEHRQSMQIEAVFRVWWKDENISWKPSDYDNISYMKVEEVWMPDLTMNVRNQAGSEEFRPSSCLVMASGMVGCLPTVTVSAPCTQDVHHWPFENHVCYFEVSSFLYYEHELVLRNGNVTRRYLIPSREWDLGSVSIQRKGFNFTSGSELRSYPVMAYKINITRHAGFYAAATVFPSLMLLTIVLTSFWLGTMLSCRLTMLGFVLWSCAMYLSYLMYLVPANGDTVPVIVTVFRDCMILATFGIVIATAVKRLSTSEGVPPLWLTNVTDRVELSILGRVLFLTNPTSPRDDEEAIIEPSAKANLWAPHAVLLDRVAFISSFVVVFVLLTGYLP